MSVGMVASLAGVIWTMLITELGVPTYAAFAIALLFGVLSGLFAGVSVAFWHMPAWMATYAAVPDLERRHLYPDQRRGHSHDDV